MTTIELALPQLLRAATGGVGAFNVVLLEHAEAIVAGAERAGRPVILQISQNCIAYHGSAAPIVRATREVARAADVEALVHLDHIEDPELVDEGIDLGVDSIMVDASRLPYDANVARTRELAERCHAAGIGVEAELGEIGGKDGAHAPGVRTDPDDAAAFVAATGVDALAVAVGTSHAMSSRDAQVDAGLIARIRATVPVPLVLHGSSGLSDLELRRAVDAGMTKVNISTHLNGLFTRGLRSALLEPQYPVDPRRYVAIGRDAVADEVERLVTLLA